MILRELFYIDKDTKNLSSDLRYDPSRDKSPMVKGDTRKTRLTLKQINELRKASEQHIIEQEADLEFVHKMYGAQPAPAA